MAAIVAVAISGYSVRDSAARRRVLCVIFSVMAYLSIGASMHCRVPVLLPWKPPSPAGRLGGTAANGIFNLIFFGIARFCLGRRTPSLTCWAAF